MPDERPLEPRDHAHGCGCGDCARDHEIQPDDMVAGIDPECAEDGLTVLQGYLAPGGSEGLWRLYLTLELDEYVLLHDADIVAQRQAGGRSLVWIRSSGRVRYVRVTEGRDVQAEFLRGRIAQRSRSDTGGAAWPGPDPDPGPLPPLTFDCPKSGTPRSRCCT